MMVLQTASASVASPSSSLPVAGSDKVGHGLAYFLLTLWWAQLVHRRAVPTLLLAFALLGVAIEFLQGASGWRTFDVNDMLANGLGALCGGGLALAAPNALAELERFVYYDKQDRRRPGY
ncbi:hypothetical protein SPRG_07852 [Saprolegnia parasitica CBS 223.65]|uniref:VanZ-like domain-containing protein n=1 Tax=Saprolegnia parasitica (strain CBS 223.65) TaxID=695850 RepID=A0A067C8Q7_SAPPC|nr:hypothetical protein SPRG_07852 [Saprolegnia parasitica CBS 223.65]KDO27144.1 hypothetical protein SPRG_07852 [Saprolegnia parasitica CBS 223.65]|eukprot:XP_012202234.1 hypothetical protein SPRG_07852 [Saprolegnia parasitica CBS 223.65]